MNCKNPDKEEHFITIISESKEISKSHKNLMILWYTDIICGEKEI